MDANLSPTDGMRRQLTAAIDDSLMMHLVQQQPNNGLCLYVGLWGVWTLNDQMHGLKTLIVTIHPSTMGLSVIPQTTTLGMLPWFIMQHQSMDEDHPLWQRIYDILRTDIEECIAKEEIEGKCHPFLPYTATQANHSIRKFADPTYLASMQIQRVDNPEGGMPFKTMDRDTIVYKMATNANAATIFVERTTPKVPCAGNMLNQERGLVKESSLLAAIGEWRTWIVLGV
jgi:hypothetical protein